MTMRRMLAGCLGLTALSLISWSRADVPPCDSCCEPVIAVESEECSGGNRDEALQRYRCNQSRHWRNMLIGSR